MPQGGDDADSSAGNDIAADAVQTPKKPAAKKKATPTPRKRKAKAGEIRFCDTASVFAADVSYSRGA